MKIILVTHGLPLAVLEGYCGGEPASKKESLQ
jgi:hypothetical protein